MARGQSTESVYYVFIYFDSRKIDLFTYGTLIFDYEPFYIGKGCNGEYKSYLSIANNFKRQDYKSKKIRKIRKETDNEVPVYFYIKNLSEKEAFERIVKSTQEQ